MPTPTASSHCLRYRDLADHIRIDDAIALWCGADIGRPVARERQDSGQIKRSTFIPLKILKRGASKVVVRPDGQPFHPGAYRGSQVRPPSVQVSTRKLDTLWRSQTTR